jgi:HEPN domain-containing protein
MKKQKRIAGALRWLLQSEQDLDDAKFNLSGSRYNVACFLAQQSAEKILKAYLFRKGAYSVWGHSVADLCDDATKYDMGFEKLFSIAGPLDMYYMPTRYPDSLPEGIPSKAFIEEDARRAIDMAEKIMDFVKSKENFMK